MDKYARIMLGAIVALTWRRYRYLVAAQHAGRCEVPVPPQRTTRLASGQERETLGSYCSTPRPLRLVCFVQQPELGPETLPGTVRRFCSIPVSSVEPPLVRHHGVQISVSLPHPARPGRQAGLDHSGIAIELYVDRIALSSRICL